MAEGPAGPTSAELSYCMGPSATAAGATARANARAGILPRIFQNPFLIASPLNLISPNGPSESEHPTRPGPIEDPLLAARPRITRHERHFGQTVHARFPRQRRRVHLRPKKRKNLQYRLFGLKGFETVMPCRGEIPGTGEMLRRIASTGLRTCRQIHVSPGRVLPAQPSGSSHRAATKRARGARDKQQTPAVLKRAVSPADPAGQRAGERRMGDVAASSVPRSGVGPCSRGAA